MSGNKWFWILSGVFILLFAAGMVVVIVLANRPFAAYDIASPTALPRYDPFIQTQTARPSPTLDPTTAMTMPATTTGQGQSVNCGWMWATQPNPELSSQIQQELAAALVNVGSVEARAESFGENCLNPDGSVRYFAVMQTDFYVLVRMDALKRVDTEAAYDIANPVVLDILRVLSKYPVDSVPGPMSGQITLAFPVRDGTYQVFYPDFERAMESIQQSLPESATPNTLGGSGS